MSEFNQSVVRRPPSMNRRFTDIGTRRGPILKTRKTLSSPTRYP
ncbi:MAG: hypothetical protein QXZ63_06715 [Sulfolobales archaeon]